MTNVKVFIKANVFRIIRLLYMTVVGIIMLIFLTLNVFFRFPLSYGESPLFIFLLFRDLLWLCALILPVFFTIRSLIAHKDDEYLGYTVSEIFTKGIITLLILLGHTLFSGLWILFIF